MYCVMAMRLMIEIHMILWLFPLMILCIINYVSISNPLFSKSQNIWNERPRSTIRIRLRPTAAIKNSEYVWSGTHPDPFERKLATINHSTWLTHYNISHSLPFPPNVRATIAQHAIASNHTISVCNPSGYDIGQNRINVLQSQDSSTYRHYATSSSNYNRNDVLQKDRPRKYYTWEW